MRTRRRRLGRDGAARQRAHRLRAVHELAFADAGADGEQQLELVPVVGRRRSAPTTRARGPVSVGSRRHAVEPRRALDVAEAGREAVDDRDVGQANVDAVRHRDHVRHELAARDVHERRRLRDRDRLVEIEIERDVVVEDLARARARRCRRTSGASGNSCRPCPARRTRAAAAPTPSTSQCCVVAGTASSIEAGHDGTANAAVVADAQRRDDRRHVREVARRRRRRHAEQVAAAARAAGSAKLKSNL